MCAKPPRTSAFISVLCTGLDRKCSGGLRLANCFARLHQFSHWMTKFALQQKRKASAAPPTPCADGARVDARRLCSQEPAPRPRW